MERNFTKILASDDGAQHFTVNLDYSLNIHLNVGDILLMCLNYWIPLYETMSNFVMLETNERVPRPLLLTSISGAAATIQPQMLTDVPFRNVNMTNDDTFLLATSPASYSYGTRTDMRVPPEDTPLTQNLTRIRLREPYYAITNEVNNYEDEILTPNVNNIIPYGSLTNDLNIGTASYLLQNNTDGALDLTLRLPSGRVWSQLALL